MEKKLTFEEAMLSLEDMVRRLEGGSLSLEESLSAFEEAVGLIKLCNAKLTDAEAKVKILVEGIDGVLTDEPFVNADEET